VSTCFVYDQRFLQHNRPGHVERRERLEAIMQALRERGLLEGLGEVPASEVAREHLLKVHREHYVNTVRDVAERGGGNLDADTYLNDRSYHVALLAAGGLVKLVNAIVDGRYDNGFGFVRPPGHHALPGRGMGFCIFNNIAVAAKYLLEQKGLERILIVDFDLHHGNGTQEIFFDSEKVLYFSTHQYPYYPGSGHWSEVGEGKGQGYTVNVPLPAGVGDEGYQRIFDEILYPLAERYRPQIVLASAGYDAHWADPLGMMQLSTTGYASLTAVLMEMAAELCAGRLAFTLEGGYDLEALSFSVAATLQALLGEEVEDPLGAAPREEVAVDDLIVHVKGAHRLV
jgi:acetoin utilization deacetylase AcuC-like enzyme